MRGAPITVRCDCGDIGYVAYGEGWVCRKCSRAWNTAQIPAEEYWGIMRDMRRLRFTVMGVALCMVVPIAALTPFVGVRILLLLPIVMSFWFIFYIPRSPRPLPHQPTTLPNWNLRPEQP